MKLGYDLPERSRSSFRGLQKDRPILLLRKAETWICDLKGFKQPHFFQALINSGRFLQRSQQKNQTKPKLNQAFNYIFWTNHPRYFTQSFPWILPVSNQNQPRYYRRWLARLGRLREPRKRDRVWRWLCPFGTQPFPIGSRRAPMGRWHIPIHGWMVDFFFRNVGK